MSTALALARSGGGFIVQPQNVNELWSLCKTLAESDLVPKDYRNKPANCFVGIQMGAELGLAPLQALQNISVINGRGSVWGDAMLALCMGHPDYVDTVETYDAETKTARCIAKRKGRADKDWSFSWADAEAAKLTSKDTYKQYTRRMLQQRARGFALRDQWPDVLKGVISAEEAQDYPTEVKAEVTSSKTVDDNGAVAKAAVAIVQDLAQKASKPVGPVFSPGWPDKQWTGRLLTDAPSNVLCDYAAYMEELQKDDSRKRLHDKARLYVEQAQAVLNERLEAEADKAAQPPTDDIADKLQSISDGDMNKHAESEGWLSQ